MPAACRIAYEAPGSPFTIALEEANVRTNCELTAYEPDFTDDIPFDRTSVVCKIIMRSTWLYDAMSELAALTPERVTVTVGEAAAFSLTAGGAYGSATVAFARDAPVLETYQCTAGPVQNSYKFAHFKQAGRAMAAAAKASVRVDGQGVLSCQFMVNVERTLLLTQNDLW